MKPPSDRLDLVPMPLLISPLLAMPLLVKPALPTLRSCRVRARFVRLEAPAREERSACSRAYPPPLA